MCEQHPKYKAATRPLADCLDCWMDWMHEHPDKTLTAHDMARILERIRMTLRIHETWIQFGHPKGAFDPASLPTQQPNRTEI